MSHWPCVKRLAHTVGLSALHTLKCEREESETLTAMAELSMQPPIVKRYIDHIFLIGENLFLIQIIFVCCIRSPSQDEAEEPMDQDDAK